MVPDTASITIRESEGGLLSLRWSGRISVTRRILAVNIFAVVVLAASFVYLDTYRTQLVDQRRNESETQVRLIAGALSAAPALQNNFAALQAFAHQTNARLRVLDAQKTPVRDIWPGKVRDYGAHDPTRDPATIKAARALDQTIDFIVGAPSFMAFSDDVNSQTSHPLSQSRSASAVSYALDRTPMISAASPLTGTTRGWVMITRNAREITDTVRAERLRLALNIAGVTILSVLLSLFLARTIVQPLRRLASAAVRVRLGRARDVTVPRLPNRNDEIGMLARALSDMTTTLRQRIDATEAFAADVAHELKNPLASLRSAVDGLAVVQPTELKAQLIDIIRHDVRRLDRLITDIAGLSRLDAQITRTPFRPVDLHQFVKEFVIQRELRHSSDRARIHVSPLLGGSPFVMADSAQLERVLTNLVDNALSFAPQGSEVRIGTYSRDGECTLWIEDEGAGVPIDESDDIFRRFHSARPSNEGFAEHSGLGLAIVRTIVEAHHGHVMVTDRTDGAPGARFTITLPAAGHPE